MSDTFTGRSVLVTGGGSGIGRAVALAFAAEGARVIATDVNETKVREIASDTIRIAKLDVLHAADIAQAAVDHGPVDILFNCAGFVHQGTILEATEDEWTLAFELNVRSMFRTIKAFLPGMLEKGRCSIINMASAASSIKGAPRRFVYGSTKAAIVGLTKSVAVDFVAQGIRCNAICPGTIHTPSLEERIAANAEAAGGKEAARAAFIARQPLGRLGTPEEIAALAVYLASDESQFVTGATMVIDGGWTI
jgi:2-keto-3-deoxy-L-fuconate dehydrogenase